jgi:hypothetical protein
METKEKVSVHATEVRAQIAAAEHLALTKRGQAALLIAQAEIQDREVEFMRKHLTVLDDLFHDGGA